MFIITEKNVKYCGLSLYFSAPRNIKKKKNNNKICFIIFRKIYSLVTIVIRLAM